MNGAWIAFVLPAALAWLAIAGMRHSVLARRLVDHPNERSLHTQPTPRVGGIGVLMGALPVAAWVAGAELRVVLACALALAAVSLADDYRSLPVVVRLAAHRGGCEMRPARSQCSSRSPSRGRRTPSTSWTAPMASPAEWR